MNTLETALQYLRKSKWSIIPVGNNKRPLVNWKEYQDRLPTEEEVKEWFKDGGNIGIVTGKISRITVVDVEKGGDYSYLPPTLCSKTGGGGFHFYYCYDERLPNKSRVKELTDIRNDGGYVLAPPSESDKGLYAWVKALPPGIFPFELFETDITQNTSDSSQTHEIPEYIGINEGGRNDAMARYIGKILPLIHPLDWETKAWDIIIIANNQNQPPLSERELRTTFDSICKSEKENPSFRKQNQQKTETPEIIKPEDEEIMLMSEVAEKQPVSHLETFSTGFQKFDDAMEGGFKEGDLIIITGQSGHGKTSLSQTFTCNLTRKNNPVLFFSYEVLVTRIWQKFQQMGMSKSSVIYSPFKTVSGSIDWIEKQILKAVEKYHTKNIIIDHLGYLMPRQRDFNNQLSQNYSVYLTSICRDLKTLAINNKLIIQLLSHVRKIENGKKVTLNDLKDSAGIVQESDHVFAIHRPLDKSESGEDVYLNDSEIYMIKNRVTGKTPRLTCTMQNNKFIEKYNIDNL